MAVAFKCDICKQFINGNSKDVAFNFRISDIPFVPYAWDKRIELCNGCFKKLKREAGL